MQHVKIGDIYENSKVVRVDKGSGLLLEVPSIPESTPAFVSVCSFWITYNVRNLYMKFECLQYQSSLTQSGQMIMIIEFIGDRYLILLKKRFKNLRKSTRKEIMSVFGFLG